MNLPKTPPRFYLVSLLGLGLLAGPPGRELRAATFVWDGAQNALPASTGWLHAPNWAGDVSPGISAGDDLVFTGIFKNTATAGGGSWSVNSLTFSGVSGSFTLNGDPLQIGAGGITNNNPYVQTLANAITLGAAQTWTATSGDLAFSGAIANAGNLLTLAGPRAFTVSGAVSGSGGLGIRDGAAVTLSGANSHTGPTTVGVGGTAGTLLFSDASPFAGGGSLALNTQSTLRLLDQGGATVTLNNTWTHSGSAGFAPANPVIDVAGAGDTLVFTAPITTTDRSVLVKDGRGTLRYAPAALASDSRWGLDIAEGVMEINQLAYRSGQNTNTGQATGRLAFSGDGTLRVVYDAGIAASIAAMGANVFNYGYGWQQVAVADNAIARIEVESGAFFKINGRTDSGFRMLGDNSTLILDGADPASRFMFGRGTAGGSGFVDGANTTIDLRGGTLSFFNSGGTLAFWPQAADFTMKLNGGRFDGGGVGGLVNLAGNLVINDAPSASAPQVGAWTVGGTGGADSSYGNVQWTGILQKVGPADTLTFNRQQSGAGTAGYVSIAPGATLDVVAGTVVVAGQQDVLTDGFDPSRHVNVALAAGTTLRADRDIGVGTLTGAGTVTTGTAGAKTLLVQSAADSTYDGAITDGAGQLILVKNGPGTQTFTAALGHSGETRIDQGAVVLADNATLLNTASIAVNSGDLILDNTTVNLANRIGDTVAISLGSGSGSGSLQYLGNAFAASTETLGVITANTGSSSLVITPGAGQSATLNLGGLTQAAGGTISFIAGSGVLGGGGGTDPAIFVSGQSAGLIGGWATVGTSFADYDLSNGIVAYTAYLNNINIAVPGSTVSLSGTDPATPNRTLAADQNNVDNLRLEATSLSLGISTRILNLQDGGLIAFGGASTISTGRLTAGGTTAGDLSVFVDTASTLTIGSIIQNNSGPGIVTVTKDGGGNLILAGTNTFSGDIYLNRGTVTTSSDARLGAANNDLYFSGGTLQIDGSFTLGAGRVITVLDGTGATLDINATRTLTLGTAGQLVSGPDSLLTKTDTGTLVVSADNTSFQSDVRVAGGTLELRAFDALGTGATKGDITLANGTTLNLRNNSGGDFGNNVVVENNATLSVDRVTAGTGNTLQIGGLTLGGGTLTVNGGNSYALAADSLSLAGAATLNINSGPLTIADVVTGAFGFTKTGAGTLTLAGTSANTYIGTATVNAGTLVLGKAPGLNATITGNLVVGDGTGTDVVRLNAAEQIANTSAVTLNTGSQLQLRGYDETIGSLTGTGSVVTNNVANTLGGTLTVGRLNTSTTYSGVISGLGGLTKEGSGNLTLTGTQTYTGATNVNAGTLTLGSGERIANASALTIASGATLEMNTFNETVRSLAGDGTVRMNGGTLTIGSGMPTATATTFSGTFEGAGTLAITDADYTFVLGADVFNSSLNITLSGGILDLGGKNHIFKNLTVTANSVIDFSGASIVNFDTLTISNGVTLTVRNWTDAVDYFFSSTAYTQGTSPLNRIVFEGGPPWTGANTKWLPYDRQVTPVPEPSAYGALLLGTAAVLALCRRRRKRVRRGI
jgi:autotransporter-associated beta strand protein